MDLSIQQLRMLREVSRQGTIAAAASQLGYTPSAVSQQLSAAEKTTGVAMLERSGRNVLLTDAGHELVSHADIVLEQLAHAQAAIERVQGDVAGVLKLGFMESVSSSMLAPIMRRLKNEHPALKLRTAAIEGLWPEELIRTGELNVSFVIGSPTDTPGPVGDGFERLVVCRDWFRLAIPASHFPDGQPPKSIALGSLAGEEFIAPPLADACSLAAVLVFQEAGLDPDVTHRVADFPTTLRLVAAEAGIALIPDLGLVRVPDGVVIVELEEPRFRTVELIYRTSSAERPAMQAFIEVVHAVADDLGLDRSHDARKTAAA